MNELRLYTEFENWIEPRGPAARAVSQYGFPGSGSTFVWQVLHELLGGVNKTHSCPDPSHTYTVAATVRDFRDVICTVMVRAGLPPTKESVVFLLTRFANQPLQELYEVQARWTDPERILWLRYEDFFMQPDYLFNQLENFLQIEIPAERRQYCLENFGVAANLKRSEAAADLSRKENAKGWLDKEWTQYTIHGINGLHITANGAIGKWKTIFPENIHGYVTDALREPLKRFQYI